MLGGGVTFTVLSPALRTKVTRLLTVVFVLGNLGFLSWFVHRYAHHYFVQVTALNAACIVGQKVGAALAFGSLGWAARGRGGGLAGLAGFEGRRHPAYLAGFLVNRMCSLGPPVYTLCVTWGRLPLFLTVYLAVDAGIAVWTALHFEQWVREGAQAWGERGRRARGE